METVDVVIRIPKDMYDRTLCTGVVIVGIDAAYIGGAIIDGTVLPKGHGKLIDADKLSGHCGIHGMCGCTGDCDNCRDYVVEVADIKKTPTIIEADTERKG